jgi:dTDP-D-glucose 4,6-dehydratase
MLAWQPAYTLDEALIETIAWYRERERLPSAGVPLEATLPLGSL